MKMSMRKMLVLLAIVLSFTAVQAVWAGGCNVTVSGEVTGIYYGENAIAVEETIVYGIPLDYLAKKLKIVLQEGDYVVITADQCPSTSTLSACTLGVNDGVVINLPGGRSR
jgi:hypothetical protein